MTWQPTKQQLEDAALAGGVTGEWSDTFQNPPKGDPMFIPYGGNRSGGMWQPHLPTTQGKADLLDLITALSEQHHVMVTSRRSVKFNWTFSVTKYQVVGESGYSMTRNELTLARAAIEVAAQVGAKMREGSTPC